MPDNRRIAKNTVFLYVRMLLVMLVALYTSRIVLKVLGAEDYGLYNAIGGVVAMFTFLNSSLGAATSRHLTFELGRKRTDRVNLVFNVAFVTHIIIAAVIVVLAETVGLWFLHEKMIIPPDRMRAAVQVYQISVITCFFSLTQVPYNALIIAHEDMKVFAWAGVADALGRLLTAFLLYAAPFDRLTFYALLTCLVQIGMMVFYRTYCGWQYPESRLRLVRNRKMYREMFSYAGSDLIGNMAVLAQGQGLNLLLNMFFGPVVNAARGIAYQVQGAVTQFGNSFMTAVKPQIIKSYSEGDVKGMMQLVTRSSCLSFFLLWAICLPIFLESGGILSLWLGEYPDHTVPFLRLVLIMCLIQAIKTPRTSAFHATGKIRLTNAVVGTLLCLALPLAYLLLKFGCSPESVFVAAISSLLVSEVASILILKRYIQYSVLSYTVQVYGRCVLVAALSLAVALPVHGLMADPSSALADKTLLRLLVTCILTTLCAGAAILAVGMDRSMRGKMIRFIRESRIFRSERQI